MQAPDLSAVTRWGKLPAWWLLHPDVDADRLAVMAALATYADDEGFCEPSQATLAKRLRRSRPWANRVVADLARHGLLRKEGRARANGGTTSCRYQLAQTPEQATAFAAAASAAVGAVLGATWPRPSPDTPRHRHDTSHADLEQTQNPRPDARAAGDQPEFSHETGPAPRRPPAEDGRSEPPRNWRPSEEALAEAGRLCPDADLDAHTAHFVARCRSKGYRYVPGATDDAWLSWLLEDRRRDRARDGAEDPRRAAGPGRTAARGGRPVSPAERADDRFDAWAAASAAPRYEMRR